MELLDWCLLQGEYIQTLTGVRTVLLNVREQSFVSMPFRDNCSTSEVCCTAYNTHLYGAYQAERWEGKYIYYCPCGLTFVAVLILYWLRGVMSSAVPILRFTCASITAFLCFLPEYLRLLHKFRRR